ncbi:hypothetical protein [Hymenobacter sp.]|uniref:hypothetical protein n=1 Tax=Hymenobacter sp. TaxID=1898978 RepID=UPI00286C6241|nr:hypothetical protein [Hymenobacter sp.]
MTADERLDQLEPLLSGALRILDQHTNQLNLLTAAATEQSSNLLFVLRQQAEMDTRLGGVETRLGGMDTKLDEMGVRLRIVETQLGGLSLRFITLANEQAEMKGQLGGITGKLDQIMDLLQKPGK